MREAIELPFGVVSGVGRGTGVLDGVHVWKGKGECLAFFLPIGFEWRFRLYFFKTEMYSTRA